MEAQAGRGSGYDGRSTPRSGVRGADGPGTGAGECDSARDGGVGGGGRARCGGGAAGAPGSAMPSAMSAGRIGLCTQPTDMRCSFDGLSARVRRSLGEEPTSGQWFVFINRRRTLLKILAFDTGGYWRWSKRLEQGRFASGRGAKERETGAESHGEAGAVGRRRYGDGPPKEALPAGCLSGSRVERLRVCSVQEGVCRCRHSTLQGSRRRTRGSALR